MTSFLLKKPINYAVSVSITMISSGVLYQMIKTDKNIRIEGPGFKLETITKNSLIFVFKINFGKFEFKNKKDFFEYIKYSYFDYLQRHGDVNVVHDKKYIIIDSKNITLEDISIEEYDLFKIIDKYNYFLETEERIGKLPILDSIKNIGRHQELFSHE